MDALHIIKNSGLRLTSSRQKIITILIKSQTALSEIDLEKQLTSCDRTTIYRTLNTLLENGIVHKLIDTDGSNKYVLNRSWESSHPDHIHFKCNECGIVECLENLSDQQLKLPEGYKKLYINFVVVGVCDHCNESEK